MAAILTALAVAEHFFAKNIFTITYCRTYMLYFVFGIIGAMLMKRFYTKAEALWMKVKVSPLSSQFISILLLIIGMSLSIIYRETELSAMILGACVLIIIFTFWKVDFPKLWVRLGDISYSFYLLHFFAARLYARVIAKFFTIRGDFYNIMAAVIFYIIVMCISYVSYRCVEVKFAKWLRKKANI